MVTQSYSTFKPLKPLLYFSCVDTLKKHIATLLHIFQTHRHELYTPAVRSVYTTSVYTPVRSVYTEVICWIIYYTKGAHRDPISLPRPNTYINAYECNDKKSFKNPRSSNGNRPSPKLNQFYVRLTVKI